jgi:hypothetical protein
MYLASCHLVPASNSHRWGKKNKKEGKTENCLRNRTFSLSQTHGHFVVLNAALCSGLTNLPNLERVTVTSPQLLLCMANHEKRYIFKCIR